MVVVVGVVVMAVVVGGGGVAVTQSHIRILASFVQVLGQVRLVFGAPGWELQVGGRRRRLEVEVGGWRLELEERVEVGGGELQVGS